jgi:hypothetical protein
MRPSEKRGETVGMRPSMTITLLLRDILIDVTTGMIIGAATDAMIVGIAIAADPEEVELITGNDHRESLDRRLLRS